jgi:hypothetical protein
MGSALGVTVLGAVVLVGDKEIGMLAEIGAPTVTIVGFLPAAILRR